MLGQIRNSVFTKFLWGFMGLFLLNISVDAPDPNPDYIPENLSFNDQESIIEIVFEKVLGFENAFKEYDDNDSEDHNSKTNLKIEFIAEHIVYSSINQLIIKTSKKKFTNDNTFLRKGFQKLDNPPPKV